MSGQPDPPAPTPPGKRGTEPIRLMLVEDHRGYRRALRAVIGLESDLDVIAEVERGDEAGDAAGRAQPDVAIVDLDLYGGDGIEAIRQIHRSSPGTVCLVLTAMQDHVEQARALAAGAVAVLHKSIEIPALLTAVRSVAVTSGGAVSRSRASALMVAAGRWRHGP